MYELLIVFEMLFNTHIHCVLNSVTSLLNPPQINGVSRKLYFKCFNFKQKSRWILWGGVSQLSVMSLCFQKQNTTVMFMETFFGWDIWLFTVILHIKIFNHNPDFSEPPLHADHRATRCYCLIVSSKGNTQELSVSTDKGIACLLWKKHPSNNGWSQAKSFDLADHFTLLTLPLCSATLTPVAHNVQYIKLRQQTNSPWGRLHQRLGKLSEQPLPSEQAVISDRVYLNILCSDLLFCNVQNTEHISLKFQHHELWVRLGIVFIVINAKNVLYTFMV